MGAVFILRPSCKQKKKNGTVQITLIAALAAAIGDDAINPFFQTVLIPTLAANCCAELDPERPKIVRPKFAAMV